MPLIERLLRVGSKSSAAALATRAESQKLDERVLSDGLGVLDQVAVDDLLVEGERPQDGDVRNRPVGAAIAVRDC